MPDLKKSSDPAEPEHDPGQREGQDEGNQAAGGPPPGPPPSVQRRDENSLSFRHFLNPQSDVVPTPFIRNQQRIGRGTNSASLDLVENPSTLPDFVQDYMVSDSQQEQGGHHPSASSSNPSAMRIQSSNSLDISSMSSSAGNGHHHQVQNNNNNSRISKSRRSLESSIRARLANIGGGSGDSSSNQASVTLPDFLSDVCDEGSAAEPSDETNERIVQLEREIYQQSRALESLQGALRVSEEKLEEANTRANYAEAKIAKLKSDMNSMKKKMLTEQGASNCRQNGETNESLNVNEVMDIARTSENLLRKLMEQVELLKSVSDNPNPDEKEKPSSSKKLHKK